MSPHDKPLCALPIKGGGMTTTGSGSYALWRSEGCQAWEAALGSYDAVIAAQSSDKLSNLDKWYSETLPKLISERNPPSIYLDELEGVAAWKMRRGVWRERNRYLVGTNDPATVEEA